MLAPYRRILALGVMIGTLSACGQPVPVVSTPPAEWVEPVAEPPVPQAADDASVADYIIGLVDALREANGKLLRLKDWREEVR